MGRGIALAYALAGQQVAVLDLKSRSAETFGALVEQATDELRAVLGDLVELGHMAAADAERALGRVRFASEGMAAEVLGPARIVYEGVPETAVAKRDALPRIGELVGAEAVIASTTSTMLVTDLADLVPQPGRFLNAHWLNPAYLIPLVELSVHPGTDKGALAALQGSLDVIGKVTVVLGPSPGFVVPRLQALVMNEAARMVAEGVASADQIDRATRYGLGFRFAAMGVLEFIDFGGNDILYHASNYLAENVDAERYALPDVVAENMREGRNGLRDGRGFYEYDPARGAEYRRDVLARTLAMVRHVQDAG
ncbi:3-hydroxyacyl-CoA dehydrogenase [Naumannella sp. ID2617S]|nr:3-hydroxyacyl-CoA dehydrogenase [Naumannella sp. ID2617S]